ncbi:hypothetical protein Tco_1208371 [Tanacetum coccineum]
MFNPYGQPNNMYGHYEYGSQHTVGDSSSQPNLFGSSSHPNLFCSSYQPNVGGSLSPVRRFSLDDDEFTKIEEVLEFLQEREEKKNKRYKSSDSSSFNMRESGEVSINLNNMVGYEEDEVEKVRRSRPIGRDQANRKVKAGDPYNLRKSQEMLELLRDGILVRDWGFLRFQHELELKAEELKIRRLENCQRDEALYESTTDEDLKAALRQRLFG